MLRTFTRNNTTLVAIVIFLFIFGLFQMIKPSFLYNNDGSVFLTKSERYIWNISSINSNNPNLNKNVIENFNITEVSWLTSCCAANLSEAGSIRIPNSSRRSS